MRRLAPALLCLPLLAPAAPLDDACAGASEPPVLVDPDFLHLRRADPAVAWAVACARRGEPLVGPPRVAEAMVRRDAALSRALLDELEPQPLPPPLRGRLLLARADLLLALQDAAPAEPLLLQAVALMGAANDGAAALVRQRLGNALWRLGRDLDRAEAWLDEAERLLAAAGRSDSLIQVNIDDGRSYIALSRDDVPGALRWAEVLRRRLIRMGLAESAEMLLVLANLGAIQAQMGRLDEALATLERGAELMARQPDALADYRRMIEGGLAGTLLRMGRPAEALPHADRALALMREAWGGGSKVLVTLSGRAEVLMALRRWAEARRDFDEAQAIGAGLADSVGPVRWLRLEANHAQVLVQLDETEAARALINSGLARLQAATPGLSFWRGRLLRQRAAIAARAGDWSAAETDLAAAEAALAAVAGTDELMPLQAGRCIAQRQGGLAGDACERLRERLPEAPRLPSYLRFLLFNALAQAEAGEAALPWHLRALAAAEDVAGPDPRWSALDALAQRWRSQGQRELAVQAGKQAVLQIEAMRADLGADAQRLERGFLSDKLGVYQRLADWLASDGRIAEALQVLRLLQREEFSGFV